MPTALSRRPAAARTPAPDPAPATYAQLKARVRETLILGQQRIEAARVITYWRTGWHIQTHLLANQRAGYGQQVLERLARDVGVDESVLRRCLHFAQRLPNLFSREPIPAARQESSQLLAPSMDDPKARLTWTHYRALLSVEDDRRRDALLRQAVRHEWPVSELAARIRREASRSDRPDPAKPPRLLSPTRGTLGLFQIKALSGRHFWDLGFESYRALVGAQARAFKQGDLVRVTAEGALERAPQAKSAELYTYEARVERVIDGDTLWMLIRLAGTDWRREKLRLRGVDCPELSTSAGVTAKRYVEAQIQRAGRIVITTTKPDQWDRYLSDVFFTTPSGEEIFLNNRLLETGHARLYAAVSPKDWDAES